MTYFNNQYRITSAFRPGAGRNLAQTSSRYPHSIDNRFSGQSFHHQMRLSTAGIIVTAESQQTTELPTKISSAPDRHA